MQKPTRIYAPSMHEALQRISRELGEHAVIVETREVGGGVEVMAAIDDGAPELIRSSRPRARDPRPDGRADSVHRGGGDAAGPGLPWLEANLKFLPHDTAPRTGRLLFLGASGVGKTLLVAKLAAAHVLRYGPDAVRLVNGDAFRFGGQTQLERLADMLGIRWLQLHRPEDLGRAVAAAGPHELVLIDTPGLRAHPGDASLDWVKAMCAAADADRCLVLSAASQRAATRAIVGRARELGVEFSTLTKLDEPADPMEVLDVVARSSIPLAWLSGGDMIPDDVEPATADQLHRWLADRTTRPETGRASPRDDAARGRARARVRERI